MDFSRTDKFFYLPIGLLGAVLCAFPFLVIFPADYLITLATGGSDWFMVRGVISWAVIAGVALVVTAIRCIYWVARIRPYRLGHFVFLVLFLFMTASYILVSMAPIRRAGFFLASAT
jgi:hypothetical protein